jgi:hypothetical protein
MSKPYNGHKNWNHWNVSLWINSDEVLYTLARECVKRTSSKTKAAQAMLDYMEELGTTKTPDGAPYSVTTIKAAMVEM